MHLALSRSGASAGTGSRGCCTLDDARDARRVADKLGIPFYVWDLSERFRDDVIADFVDEYRSGRTPNPCLRCNEKIKFSAVLDRALAMDFDVVATGHYARIVHGPDGPELHRAVDPAKDQSYVLGVLTTTQLAHSAFPLGDDVKDDVRDEAERRGLLVARKPDSHDICFIPDGDTAAFVRSRVGAGPGDIVDADPGEVLARHEGAHAFTIGQRRGLNLRVPGGRRCAEVRGRRRHHHQHRARRPARTPRRRPHRGHPCRVGRSRCRCRARWRSRRRCVRTACRCRRRARMDGDRLVVDLDAADPRSGRRAGGRPLRRHARDRLGDRRRHSPRELGRVGSVTPPWSPVAATGVGSMPGTSVREATRIIAGELPGFLHVAELPARGPGADIIGRTGGLLASVSSGMGLETTPDGWRFTAGLGREMRRAVSFLGEDLDALEESAVGYAGPVKIQVAGPWTLAAAIELTSGERVLRDPAAAWDIAQALGEAVADQVADLRRRLPSASAVVVQLDEPGLPAVLAGHVGTASGLSSYRAVDPQTAERVLGHVLSRAADAGAVPGVHCCAADPPVTLLRSSGAEFVSLDLALAGESLDEDLGLAFEAGIGHPGRRRAVDRCRAARRHCCQCRRCVPLLHRLGMEDDRWLDAGGRDSDLRPRGRQPGVGAHGPRGVPCGGTGAAAR